MKKSFFGIALTLQSKKSYFIETESCQPN